MIKNIGSKTFLFCQRKSDPDIKRAYLLVSGQWEKKYEGDRQGLTAFVEHEKKLWHKRETRSMVADICGTSYRAAMADMGLARY